MPAERRRREIEHGTYRGWGAHRRAAERRGVPLREELCDPCRAAYNAYQLEYYRRHRDETLERRRAWYAARVARRRAETAGVQLSLDAGPDS